MFSDHLIAHIQVLNDHFSLWFHTAHTLFQKHKRAESPVQSCPLNALNYQQFINNSSTIYPLYFPQYIVAYVLRINYYRLNVLRVNMFFKTFTSFFPYVQTNFHVYIICPLVMSFLQSYYKALIPSFQTSGSQASIWKNCPWKNF